MLLQKICHKPTMQTRCCIADCNNMLSHQTVAAQTLYCNRVATHAKQVDFTLACGETSAWLASVLKLAPGVDLGQHRAALCPWAEPQTMCTLWVQPMQRLQGAPEQAEQVQQGISAANWPLQVASSRNAALCTGTCGMKETFFLHARGH